MCGAGPRRPSFPGVMRMVIEGTDLNEHPECVAKTTAASPSSDMGTWLLGMIQNGGHRSGSTRPVTGEEAEQAREARFS